MVVPSAGRETREKAHYLFDVAVFDEYIDVRLRNPPNGGAFDDSSISYVDELKELSLGHIAFGTRFSDPEFMEAFNPLFTRGKQKQVRSYPCIFSVKVWDKTSLDAKARWKRANGVLLQGYFGTYLVRDEDWPYQPI